MKTKTSLVKRIYQAIPFKRQFFEIVRSVYVPPRSVFRHLFFGGKFKVQVGKKFFYMNHYNTHGFVIEDGLFWQGLGVGREGFSLRLWQKLSEQSEVIFDIGANTGMYSLLSKAVNSQSKVYGFEPTRRIYEKYKANCQLNNFDIHCEWMAVSDTTGEVVIYDLPIVNNYSATINKNFSDVRHAPLLDSRLETKVPCTTVKDYIEKNNIQRVDLMKIDVELHEPEVLNGIGEYLVKFHPTLLIEVMNDSIATRIEASLKGCNYLYFVINEEGEIHKTDKIFAANESNYLICREDVAKKLALI
ncbi:FkbM family methyltransferase [Xanthocytophaga agilis]|uniref:FkbM family methyltransferase n=1 Tax=Xanthocytophaga agilis TaxID=3048010 RepID=A0AAE3RAY3_9BACT|nr:FkbM family methyltransferase [Xanthocytophaga agilis]MDJ1504699.1 FkbM family methyltransferase [Xanthocytophaga agilis]